MKRKKIVFFVTFIVLAVIASTTIILAAPTINLSVNTNNNTANLSWTNNDSVKSYNYNVKRSVNGGSFENLAGNTGNEVTVLNIYPDGAAVDQNISFTTYDGENLTLKKSASLKMWMEQPNATDSRGWGRGLIEVTPVSITDFNNNPSGYLKKVGGKYNYDVVVFGTWDAYAAQDLSTSAANVMRTYLAEGNSCVMGHDTIRGDVDRAANFASLRSYFNIKTALDDGVKDINGAPVDNVNGGNPEATTQVTLRTNNVFTTYPWNIGSAGTILSVPQCHCVQQVAYGNVEITFTNTGDIRDQNGQGNWNYYLTVHNNTAMIQTGHSSGAATADEQKIWANLLFYLGDINNSTTAVDNNFKDINAPNIPSITKATLVGVNGKVSYTATDNGTTYKYYVEATERVSLEKTSSNTITKERKTEVAGYSYVIDTNASTIPDGTIDTTTTNIDYILGNGPKTYLHIRAIDGAGNAGPTAHVLLHENIPPELALSHNPTQWTNQDVTITAVGTDVDGTVVTVKKPNGTTVNGSTTTHIVGVNGIYEFEVTDNSGAKTKKSIEITNIDKVKPEGTYTITQPTTAVRGAVINFSATDDASGVSSITKPDGSIVTALSTTYTVTEPGTYTFKILDRAGNEQTVDVDVAIVSDGLEVKYIDQVTGQEIATKDIITGYVNDDYTTSPKAVEGYELVKTPTNANGKLTIDKITVTYEYRKNSNVIVEYIDENYNTNIIANVVTKYKEGDAYTTEEKVFPGYQLTGKTTNTSGTVGNADITVTYKYKKISAGVEIRYIDQVTGDIIADTIVKTGLEKAPYTSAAKTVEGYELVLTPVNANGEMVVEKTVVTYEYRKNSYVTVKYIDENNGQTLFGPVNTKYKEGDIYTTVQEDISGYTFTRVDGEKTAEVGRENIVVTYYYKKNTSVTVRYVDMLDKNKEIVESVVIPGLENDDYETEQKDIDGYIFVETSGLVNGKMKSEPTEVIYKYKKASKLITEHIDENSGEKIVADVETIYKEGDTYEALAQSIPGYVLVREPDEKTGVMGRENVTKTFYYKKLSGGLVVKYVDRLSGDLLDQEIYEGNEADKIILDEKVFLGYVLDGRPEFDEVILGVKPQEVIFYYKKTITIDLIGIDQETGEEIYATEVSGVEGDTYTTIPRDVDGYEVVRIPNNANGTFTREDTKIIYEYRKTAGKITVKYVDKETNEELGSYVISGKEGENYQTERKSFKDYDFVEVVGEEVGVLDKTSKEVVYYYVKKSGKLVVRYIDTEGNELLREETVAKVGEPYKVEEKEIKGYEVIQRPENLEGKYEEGITEVIFIVKKIVKGKVVVKYVDKETGKELDRYVIDGREGDSYQTEKKEFENYKFIEVKGAEAGVISKEEKEVVYYYERKTGNVVVIYEDENGKELLKEELTGKAGDDYKVTVKNITGYEIVEVPENLSGKYIEGTIELVIKLKEKEKGKIIVKFVDENGNIMREDLIDEDEVGKSFYLELPEFEGYEIVGEKVIEAKFENGELVFTAEYRKIENKVEEIPETGDINIIMLVSICILSIIVLKRRFTKE